MTETATSLADEAIAAARAAAAGEPEPSSAPGPDASSATSATPARDASPSAGATQPARVASITVGKNVVAILIDQAFHTVWKRQARRLGLSPLSPAERAALHLSDDERDEIETLAQGGVSSYIEKHAEWIEKLSLALFGFVLWSIYKDRSDAMREAAAERRKSGEIDPSARNAFLRRRGSVAAAANDASSGQAVRPGPVPPGAVAPGSWSEAGIIDPTPRGKHL